MGAANLVIFTIFGIIIWMILEYPLTKAINLWVLKTIKKDDVGNEEETDED